MIDRHRTYGGFLPIHINNCKGEWYSNHSMKLNSARNAIVTSMIQGGYKKIYLPIYTCETVSKTLLKYNYNVVFYNIRNDFTPDLSNHQIKEIQCGQAVLLIVNYFGVFFPSHLIDNISKENIIIDNTQCFFEKPNLDVYNVYSCRKFFGVSDGAYLVKKGLKAIKFDQDYSSDRATFLLKSFEKGTNFVYDDYILAEEDLNNSAILKMSSLTESILSSVDYEKINQIRLDNFMVLFELLKSLNELEFDIPKTAPMVYPLLVEKNDLRSFLIKSGVYVSQWWKWVLDFRYSNEMEKRLSRFLLPLPIDQRYNQDDMKKIVDIVKMGI